jgi:hypothetical protein
MHKKIQKALHGQVGMKVHVAYRTVSDNCLALVYPSHKDIPKGVYAVPSDQTHGMQPTHKARCLSLYCQCHIGVWSAKSIPATLSKSHLLYIAVSTKGWLTIAFLIPGIHSPATYFHLHDINVSQ